MPISRKKLFFSIIRIVTVVVAFAITAGCLVSQPSFRKNKPSAIKVEPAALRSYVVKLSTSYHPRDYTHRDNLNACADFIAGVFTEAGAQGEMQEFQAMRRPYRNVIGRFGVGRGSKVVIGAHYDTCDETPGADDNASGVAGLLELARLFSNNPPPREVELVAYCLEEPPFFRTSSMGSAVHAKSLANRKEPIAGVIVLEMIGCFRDDRGSQSYPVPLLRLTYPGTANFIAVVGPWNQGQWIKHIKSGMQGTTELPVYSLRAPSFVQGVDFSDHMNYWPYDINAVMVTDTSFYRNPRYHGAGDTADTLDYQRMAMVVVGVFEAVGAL